jgi:hypothetical protein
MKFVRTAVITCVALTGIGFGATGALSVDRLDNSAVAAPVHASDRIDNTEWGARTDTADNTEWGAKTDGVDNTEWGSTKPTP